MTYFLSQEVFKNKTYIFSHKHLQSTVIDNQTLLSDEANIRTSLGTRGRNLYELFKKSIFIQNKR